MAWLPRDNQTLWVGDFARGARADAPRTRHRHRYHAIPPVTRWHRWLGNEDFESERLVAYEIGDRWQPLETLSFDLALFYNDYDRLASLEFGEPFIDTDGRTVIPVINENLTAGRTYGAETAGRVAARRMTGA